MFILGMLSLMDAILDLPITTVACQVAISAEVRAALFGSDNRLRRCLDLVLAYESADWTACESLRADRSIPADTLSSAYLESLHWAAQFADAVV
jgi:c-di-GMP phosphodiesterase